MPGYGVGLKRYAGRGGGFVGCCRRREGGARCPPDLCQGFRIPETDFRSGLGAVRRLAFRAEPRLESIRYTDVLSSLFEFWVSV